MSVAIEGAAGIPAELREARRQSGMNQTTLAAEIGVSKTTISNWENGHGEPSITEWRAIARATQCGWLLSGGWRTSHLGRQLSLANLPDGEQLELTLSSVPMLESA